MMIFVLKMMTFAFKMIDFVFKMMIFALKMMTFVSEMMNSVFNMMMFALKRWTSLSSLTVDSTGDLKRVKIYELATTYTPVGGVAVTVGVFAQTQDGRLGEIIAQDNAIWVRLRWAWKRDGLSNEQRWFALKNNGFVLNTADVYPQNRWVDAGNMNITDEYCIKHWWILH